MKWLRNSWNIAKTLSVTIASFSMVISPVAQGAAAKKTQAPVKVFVDYSKYNWKVDKKSTQDFLKFANLGTNKKTTVGEFYQKMRPYYPKTLQRQLDLWVMAHRNDMMPDVQASTYKDAEGKDQIRLILSKNGQSVTLSYNPESKDKYLKFNNTYLSRVDLLYFEQAYRRLAHNDKAVRKSILEKRNKKGHLKEPIKLTYAEYKRMTPKQRAAYMVRLRELVQSAEKVFKSFQKTANLHDNKYEYFAQWVLGLEAEARSVRGAKVGDPCVVAGYISVYGNNFSCGGEGPGREHLNEQMQRFGGANCGNGKISCNPLLYNNNGQTICMTSPSAAVTTATYGRCPQQSPLKTAKDKENLINGYLKAQGFAGNLKVEDDGRASKAGLSEEEFNKIQSYIFEVNNYVDSAVGACQVLPLSATAQVREEQAKACEAIALRKINLDFYDVAVPLPPPVVGRDCSFEKPGSESMGNDCVCVLPKTDGNMQDPERGSIPACIDPIVGEVARDEEKIECNQDEVKHNQGEESEKCKKAGGFFMGSGWLWALGGAAVVGGLLWWLSKDDDDKEPNPQVPVDPCPVATTVPPAPSCVPAPPPPVTPPPVTPPPPIIPDPSPTATPPPPVVEIPPPVPVTVVENTSNGPGATGASGSAR